MSDILRCPYCGGILEQSSIFNLNSYACTDLACKGYFMTATKDMWQELIRTRKALEIAVDALKEIDELLSSNKFDVREVPLLNITQTKISMLLKCINIEQITTLEQKDK